MAIAFRSATSTGTSTGSSPFVMNAPAGLTDGDVMVAFTECGRESSRGAQVGPSGWTNTVSNNQETGPSHNFQCWTKTATASEPASYTWTNTSGGAWAGTILAYSGVGAIGATASGAEVTLDTTITHDGLTTTTDNAIAIYAYAVNESSSPTRIPLTAHASTTKRGEANSTVTAVGMGVTACDETRATAGATGDRSATTAGGNSTNTWIGIELVAASGGGGGALLKKLLLG